ncbi:defective in cullin neddylation protein 1 [Pleomassaria siparia CBS 279.74]|uniref:Defective in cullin neddylation protein n=1 Tax=Pleomassaria siparia CBS 279.74 TaxID=1314801 RepID=A0A6G1K016_9PLEO|nr:defective in cullin neddylation protein 1 [Pleomassaria siparia CBS 279.74]
MLGLLLTILRPFSFFSGNGSASISSGTKASLNKVFDKYRDDVANSPDAIGVNGTMSYLEDIGVDTEGLDCLAVFEVLQAPAMGEMTREGFVDGWINLNCDTLDKQKAYVNMLKDTLPTSNDTFAKVYKHTFQLAKSGGQKAVPLETATAYWELLFDSPLSAVKWNSRSTPWSTWWIEFLNSSWKKSVNKDMWNETLKFAQLTLKDEAMSFWSEESSWPSVIDEFVEYVKIEKRGGSVAVDEMEY